MLKKLELFIERVIKGLLENTGVDKLLHFYVGSWISFLSFVFLGFEAMIGITVIVAGAKEIVWDKIMEKGTPSLWDFVMSVLPMLFIIGVRSLILFDLGLID